MVYRFVFVAVLLLSSGCGMFTKPVRVPAPIKIPEQERSFAGALEFLKAGREQQARDLLEKVVTAPSINGITDEALFRLALLTVRDENGRGPVRTRTLLERLSTEFPRSIWTHQVGPLEVFLENSKFPRDKQRELKTLRDLNLSLSKDNRELRQTIERLKSLDLELDQKIRH